MKARFITPTIHGTLDYIAALGLIFLPILLSLQQDSLFVYWFSIITGFGLITYSLLTNYKFGLLKVISYKIHLLLDAIASSSFLILAFVHKGTMLSTIYCLIMGIGVVVVILLSGTSDKKAVEEKTVLSHE